ncbi:619_t:CDS:2 [Dentiscutata erythropus]|uniref:619_t:CDS:1 n=1 Tax=Dentiscutata erythropus TaxID=1348616 RepID=A0A9N9ILN2_9GLOM|nr:619_t:CDS:2 [Dentiscutata erythropus]
MLPFKRTYESTVDPEDIEEIESNQHFCSQQFQPRDFLQFQQQIFFNSHLYAQDDLSVINDFELYSQIQPPTSISVNVMDPTPSTSIDDKSSLTSEEFQRLKKIVDLFMKSNNSKNNSSNISSSLTNRNSTSIILNFSTCINEQTDIKLISSPLNSLINPTFPNYYFLVDLILKVKKKNMNTNSTFLSQDIRSPKLTTYCIKYANDTPTFSPSGLSINPSLNDLCRSLINLYFTKLNPIIPLIDPKRFRDQCERKKTKHFELLLHSILTMVSVRFPCDPSLKQSLKTPASIFFNSAKKLLDTMYDTPRLETIQSLLLLSMSELTPPRFDNGYMFLGMAIQMAHLLRIDVIDNSLDPAENEERQRIYHCLYIPKPPALNYVPNQVPLPKLVSFPQLVKDHFIASVELSHILGCIWTFGYSPSSKPSYKDWRHHLANPASDFKKIRSALANWLKKLPNTLQYLYLPATDLRSIYQLASFSDPIQICLNSAIAIIDITKTTREFDADAFYHFTSAIYGLLQATTIQLVIMNISKEYKSIVKLSLENSVKEVKLVSKRCALRILQDAANELENIVKVINELKSSNDISQLSEFQDDHNNDEDGLSSL